MGSGASPWTCPSRGASMSPNGSSPPRTSSSPTSDRPRSTGSASDPTRCAPPRARVRPHHRVRGRRARRRAGRLRRGRLRARSGIAEALRAWRPPAVPARRHGRSLGRHDGSGDGERCVGGAPGRGGARWCRPRCCARAYTIGFDVNIALMWGRSWRSVCGRRWAARRSTTTRPGTADPSGSSVSRATAWPALARRRSDEWLTDERFADRAGRARNAAVLIEELDAIFATRPLSEWAGALKPSPISSGAR